MVLLFIFAPLCIDVGSLISGVNNDRLIKIIWLFLAFLSLCFGRVKNPGPIVLAIISVYTCWLLLSLFSVIGLSSEIPESSKLAAYIGYTYYWIILCINFEYFDAKLVLRVIRLLPSFSALIGLFWSLIGVRELFRFDERIPRFQGALTPATFSMLCLGAVTASLLWLRLYATFDWFIVVNFFFCLISGTRNTTLCFGFVLFVYLVTKSKKGVKVRKAALFIISLLTLVVFSGVVRARLSDIDLLNNLKTSGRTNAWQFYESFFWDNKWFGHGLGFSSSVNELRGISSVSRAFVSPHNSYLQLLLDIGVIGSSILLVILMLTLMSNARRRNSIIFTDYKGTLRPLVLTIPFFFAFDNYINTPQFNILVMVVFSLMIKKPIQGYRLSANL